MTQRSDTGAVTVQDTSVILEGRRFHYREWGNSAAPPLVLLHAYMMHAGSWDTVARRLARRFRVLALDQRGHGESEWAADYHELRLLADLASFVDALGLDEFDLVGLSIGGYAACSYATLYPARVRRLVMSECFSEDPSEMQVVTEGTEHIRAMRGLPVVYVGTAAQVAQQAAEGFRPLAPFAAEDELRRWMLAGLKQEGAGRWTWRYDPILRAPGPEGRLNPTYGVFKARLPALHCPTLMVVGTSSFHADSAGGLAQSDPRLQLAVIENAGHWVPLDNPVGFLAAVEGFLAGA
jgi:pimeloyl-ACP methyl ester carboxylesterase